MGQQRTTQTQGAEPVRIELRTAENLQAAWQQRGCKDGIPAAGTAYAQIDGAFGLFKTAGYKTCRLEPTFLENWDRLATVSSYDYRDQRLTWSVSTALRFGAGGALKAGRAQFYCSPRGRSGKRYLVTGDSLVRFVVQTRMQQILRTEGYHVLEWRLPHAAVAPFRWVELTAREQQAPDIDGGWTVRAFEHVRSQERVVVCSGKDGAVTLRHTNGNPRQNGSLSRTVVGAALIRLFWNGGLGAVPNS